MKKTFWDGNTSQDVERHDNMSFVVRGSGYQWTGDTSTTATDTGNGFIVRFLASNSTEQDYYVCLDYSQAHDLIIAMSAFKKELGFV